MVRLLYLALFVAAFAALTNLPGAMAPWVPCRASGDCGWQGPGNTNCYCWTCCSCTCWNVCGCARCSSIRCGCPSYTGCDSSCSPAPDSRCGGGGPPPPPPPEVCTDGVDNDGDTLVDEADPNCCSWCESAGWQWDIDGGSCAGASNFTWDAVPPQVRWCCGNSPQEAFTAAGIGPDACCPAAGMCVDASGTCRSGSEVSPGGCTDGVDNDCDGTADISDSACAANISGRVTDDGGGFLPNVTVQSLTTDPLSNVSLQFSVATGPDGWYSMRVAANLSYDVITVLPGYETGFAWNRQVPPPGLILDFSLSGALACEQDCTLSGEVLCRPECHGVAGCQYSDVRAMRVCENRQASWLVPYNASHELWCCDGIPGRARAVEVVSLQGPRHVATIERILSFGGRIIKLVVNVFR